MDKPFVPVGRVVKAHGLYGEVSVAPAARPPFAFPEGLEVWFTPPPLSGPRSARVEGVRRGPKGPLVKLSGIDSIDDASRLNGSILVARPGDLPPEAFEEEPDPVGIEVVDTERGALGIIEDVILTGANDVWVIHGPFGQVLVPVVDEIVLEVDHEARRARVRLIPGLIDEG